MKIRKSADFTGMRTTMRTAGGAFTSAGFTDE